MYLPPPPGLIGTNMRVTQGQLSFLSELAELADVEIAKQIGYALDQGWAPAVEHAEDPYPH